MVEASALVLIREPEELEEPKGPERCILASYAASLSLPFYQFGDNITTRQIKNLLSAYLNQITETESLVNIYCDRFFAENKTVVLAASQKNFCILMMIFANERRIIRQFSSNKLTDQTTVVYNNKLRNHNDARRSKLS
ncbi:hypothetical protein LOAG_06642 [Loa loa]|uniref:Uncharacterized protein n=1 Tax=Loa loa TaxID=7209 RepID=A0A1S0TZ12_LOALO|nr:hypothetical protein LOAG_06642 [Loa loa]EFO21844.1 hypothetical protein LOAG_06642 [Loa loa]